MILLDKNGLTSPRCPHERPWRRRLKKDSSMGALSSSDHLGCAAGWGVGRAFIRKGKSAFEGERASRLVVVLVLNLAQAYRDTQSPRHIKTFAREPLHERLGSRGRLIFRVGSWVPVAEDVRSRSYPITDP